MSDELLAIEVITGAVWGWTSLESLSGVGAGGGFVSVPKEIVSGDISTSADVLDLARFT